MNANLTTIVLHHSLAKTSVVNLYVPTELVEKALYVKHPDTEQDVHVLSITLEILILVATLNVPLNQIVQAINNVPI